MPAQKYDARARWGVCLQIAVYILAAAEMVEASGRETKYGPQVWIVSASIRSAEQTPNKSTPADERRAKAERAVKEAEELLKAGTKESLGTAIGKWEEARALFQAIDDRAGEAEALHGSGFSMTMLGENRRALEILEKALSLRRTIGDKKGEASTLTSIAAAYYSLSDYRKALDYFQLSLDVRRAILDRTGQADMLSNIGVIYNVFGDRQKALEHFQQSLKLNRELGNQASEAATLSNIGAIYNARGDRQEALDYFHKALTLEQFLKNLKGEARTLNNIGTVYGMLGDSQKALQYYLQALSLWRTLPDRSAEGKSLGNIGNTYSELGDNQKALEYLRQALELQRAVENRTSEAIALHDLGAVLYDLRDYQKALEYFQQSLVILRDTGDRDTQAVALSDLGKAYNALGDRPKALEHYLQALPLHRAVQDRRSEADTLARLSFLYKSSIKPGIAIFLGKEAINVYQSLRADINILSPKERLIYLKSISSNYHELADALADQGRLPEAQQVLALFKQEEYSDFIRRSKEETDKLTGRVSLTPSEARAHERFTAAGDEVSALETAITRLSLLRDITPEQQEELKEKESALAAAIQRFPARMEQIATDLSDVRAVKDYVAAHSDFKKLGLSLADLGTGVVLLTTFVTDKAYRVILTTSAGQVERHVEINEADLNKLVLEFREAIQNPAVDPRPAGKRLYKVLVGPVEADLKRLSPTTLVWSLDGALRYVPIAALWDGRQYLVERYATAMATLASYGHLNKASGARWRGLGLGVSKEHMGLRPLRNVVEEMKKIFREDSAGADRSPIPGRVLLDEQFTVAAMQKELEAGYQLVHIASHFVFDPGGDEKKSYLLLGDGSKLSLDEIKYSGKLTFKGVALLTLAACDTAVGTKDADGREFEGFAVLAQKRGAQAVMASLWPVADRSTAELMRMFYSGREAKRGVTKATSLRQAQLALLKGEMSGAAGKELVRTKARRGADRGRAERQSPAFIEDARKPFTHPFYWAPFVLMGKWR